MKINGLKRTTGFLAAAMLLSLAPLASTQDKPAKAGLFGGLTTARACFVDSSRF